MAIQGNGVSTMGPFAESLASLPQLPQKRATGDGTEPGGTGASTPTGPVAPKGAMTTADERASTPPAILTSSSTIQDAAPTVKFLTVEKLVRSQDRIARNRWAIDTHFDRIRSGVPFSRLEKVPNQNVWVAKLPNGMTKESAGATPNKADDLCNKVVDTLMSDPPKPDPLRHINDETAREAAELAAAFLSQDGGEAGTNDNETYRWAIDTALTRAAAILHYRVDPTGGGYQALQVLAHPQATDVSNPLVAQVPGPVDPATGQPSAGIQEQAVNPVLRYVSAPDDQHPDGQFVQEAAQADRVWLPKIVIDRMRREQVRCVPVTSTPETAAAVVVIRWMTLDQARREWPETVGQMSAEALQGLVNWRPAMSETFVVPYAFRGLADGQTGPGLNEVGSLSPLLQRRMYSYRLYVKASPEYPDGYWLDVSGASGGQVLGEGTLEYAVTLARGGQTKRCRDLPLVTVRPMQDVSGGDPLGWPFISRFAGASEAEATLYAAFMDICDNMLHPHVFIRSNVAVDDDDWADRTMPIILGASDPEPTYEHFPALPPVLPLLEKLDQRQDVISGLTSTAQGLDSSAAVSGVAKSLTVRQALVNLSGFQQQLHAAMTRGWRIKCQLAQAEFTTPQLLTFAGEDASAEPTWWTGEDFAGVDRVGIQPGTGTMMTPEGKAQYVAFLQGQNWMQPDAAAEVALPGIRMDLGIPDNPLDAALERSISAWLKGMPEGWDQAQQAYTQAKQAYDAQQQQRQSQQAQASQQAAVGQQQQAVAQQEQAKQQAAMALEQHKAETAMQVEHAKHQMAMEAKQMDAHVAERTALAAAPQTPVIEVPPPDLSEIGKALEGITQVLAILASKEAAPVVQVPPV